MQEYFLNKDINSIEYVTNNGKKENKVFVNERPDDYFNKEMITINNCTFASIGFKKSKIKSSKINHTVFINCYFNRTEFNQVDLTGCSFINCKFENPVFILCDFKYVVFKGCHVRYKEIINTLPIEYNIRWKLCTNLAMECLQAGNSEEYKKFFFEEKKASENHYLNNMFKRTSEFYKKKYGMWESITGVLKYSISRISYYLWGYGEHIKNLIVTMVTINFLFTYIIYNRLLGSKSIGSCIYISLSQFFNIKGNDILEIIQKNNLEYLALTEGIIGVVFIGFLVSAIFRSVNRR